MKKILIFIVCLLFSGSLVAGFLLIDRYGDQYRTNVKEDATIFIGSNFNKDQIDQEISKHLLDIQSYIRYSKGKDIKPGKYKIKKGYDNKELLNILAFGKQQEVKLRVKNYENMYELSGDFAKNIEADSLTILNSLNDIAREKGLLDIEDLKQYIFADTYFVFWNTAPKDLFLRLEKESNLFWTPDNIEKIKKLDLNQQQAYTLASIVQREYYLKEEVPIISSLYLNRLKIGIKIQSDPTVIYAIKREAGFKTMDIKRVSDLSVDSPYNTYKYSGLPPTPICIVDKQVLKESINPSQTDYIFMCADPHNKGKHLFTSSIEEHNKNAMNYKKWLEDNNIK